MASGNAIYTYTGPKTEETIQGQTFTKDEPKHLMDQGVIAVCEGRDDFVAFNASRDGLVNPITAKPKRGKAK